MSEDAADILIIGGGPGGYVCAIRAGQLGLKTILVEAQSLGGTCLNIGCIPSKALIHAAEEFYIGARLARKNPFGIKAVAPEIDLSQTMLWKDGIVDRLTGGVQSLLKKAGVTVLGGHAQLIDGKSISVTNSEGVQRVTTRNMVIATGSEPLPLQSLPFGGDILSSTEVLALQRVPQSLAVVGGGYIGLEIGTAMAKLGAQVSIIEAGPRILPQYDAELTRPISKRLETLGIRVMTDAKATGYLDGHLQVETPAGSSHILAEKLLVTVGRKPRLNGFSLENLMLDRDGPFIAINDQCRSSMTGVYAIGDVTAGPMLAHRAMAQGALVAEVVAAQIAGGPRSGPGKPIWDKRAIPAVCFTDPEIVTVGALPSDEPKAKVSQFPFAGNGRAMTLDRPEGFVRIVSREDGLILGMQAVGAGVSELAGQFAQAIEMASTLTDIADTIHAHPTLGETLQEAALKGLGRALHG